MTDSRGNFTFLFTDVEGSSRLWEEHAETMALALARHDTLLSDVFSGHGGHVFKMMGDSVCVAFHESAKALSAAIDAQHALLNEEWETPRPLRVRTALHRGVAEVRNADYFGPTLNRTARLLAAGHGGQTLLSRAAREDVALPEGISLRDLGERRLRDLSLPERIYQIVAPGLPSDFPPLRSLEVLPNNLPAQITSFVGREREMSELKALLERSRLVTLTGPGGTGKTRLSMEVAVANLDRFTDGVWLVELATLSEAGAVVVAVASALGLREERERELEKIVAEYLRNRKLLLILDNCEHLIAACATLAEQLLRSAANLHILATSREALGIPGETAYAVHSLSLPDFFEESWTGSKVVARARDFEALSLFVERATAVLPTFKLTEDNALTVARICWRLDGIPLAIELAAARVKMLAPDQIYRRLDDRFHLLTGGGRTVLPRQQTLTALIDWSYDLLSEKERALLLRAAAFGRGRTLRALEFVCSGKGIEEFEILDLLQQLIDKSLLTVEHPEGGGARYFMLESIWEYARGKLVASGDAGRVLGRHLDYYLRMAEEAEDKLTGAEQSEWLDKLKSDHGNFQLALDWSAETTDAAGRGLRLAGALTRYWEIHSHLKEGRDYLTTLLVRPETQARDAIRAKGLWGAGRLAWCMDADDVARTHYLAAVEIYRGLGKEREVMFLHALLGFVEWSDGNRIAARTYLESALSYARTNGDQQIAAIALSGLGTLVASEGDHAAARVLKEESLSLYRTIGDQWVISLICWSLGKVIIVQRDFSAARLLIGESASGAQQLGNEWLIPYLLEAYGEIARGEMEPELGVKLYAAAEVLRERLGLALSAAERIDYQRAVDALRETLPPDRFQSAWTEGRALAPDEALGLATR